MAGQLTTHVLDIAQGRPAVGMALALWRLNTPYITVSADPANLATCDPERTLLLRTLTNKQGRTDTPLLIGEHMIAGVYELVFAVGAYFAQQTTLPDQRPLLDIVPLRFTITSPEEHYHIPLLASPWAYSTYRGS
jgi:5-hydroxyisourate hydrolase